MDEEEYKRRVEEHKKGIVNWLDKLNEEYFRELQGGCFKSQNGYAKLTRKDEVGNLYYLAFKVNEEVFPKTFSYTEQYIDYRDLNNGIEFHLGDVITKQDFEDQVVKRVIEIITQQGGSSK